MNREEAIALLQRERTIHQRNIPDPNDRSAEKSLVTEAVQVLRHDQTLLTFADALYYFSPKVSIADEFIDNLIKTSSFKQLQAAPPYALLIHAESLKTRPDHEALFENAFTRAATERPGYVLRYAHYMEHASYELRLLETAFRNAVTKDPISVLNYRKLLVGQSYESTVLETAFRNAATINPVGTLYWAELMIGKPYEEEVLKTAFTHAVIEAPGPVLYHATKLIGRPYREEILRTAFTNAAMNDSYTVLHYAALMKGKPYEEEVLKAGFLKAAIGNTNIVVEKRALLQGKPYEAEIIRLLTTTERGSIALGQHFNLLHELPDAQRFAWLKKTTAADEFDIITRGRSEVYTSTYRGVLDAMLADLKAQGKPLTSVLSPEQSSRMGVFLEAAASYDRMEDVLRVIPTTALPGIMRDLVDKATTSEDLSYSNSFVTLMLALQGNPEMRHLLEQEVKSRYEKLAVPEEKDRLGLIASAYGSNRAERISPDMKSFFIGLAHHPRYQLPDLRAITREQLVDNKGVSNQLMVFANDDDSKASFANFKATYANKANWSIHDRRDYVLVESKGGAGIPVRIYANKPVPEQEAALEAIQAEVARTQGAVEPSFQGFAGRGHSYHAEQYLELITPSMHLIHLGSCGGFHNLGTALSKSPDAHVISSQQVGSMFVNDPLLFSINESIRTRGEVVWGQQQTRLDSLTSTHRESYILPDCNVAALMQMRYNQLKAEEAASPQKVVEPEPAAEGASLNTPTARQIQLTDTTRVLPPRIGQGSALPRQAMIF